MLHKRVVTYLGKINPHPLLGRIYMRPDLQGHLQCLAPDGIANAMISLRACSTPGITNALKRVYRNNGKGNTFWHSE